MDKTIEELFHLGALRVNVFGQPGNFQVQYTTDEKGWVVEHNPNLAAALSGLLRHLRSAKGLPDKVPVVRDDFLS